LANQSKRSMASILQEIIEARLAEGVDAPPARLLNKDQSAA